MTNTAIPGLTDNYTHPARTAPAAPAGSVRLSLTPELSEVWLTGPRAGQRVVPAKISYRRG